MHDKALDWHCTLSNTCEKVTESTEGENFVTKHISNSHLDCLRPCRHIEYLVEKLDILGEPDSQKGRSFSTFFGQI